MYPRPLIIGLDIAGPVLNCVTPGVLESASIKLVETPLKKSSFLIMLIGVGVFLLEVVLKKLVTVTLVFSSTA